MSNENTNTTNDTAPPPAANPESATIGGSADGTMGAAEENLLEQLRIDLEAAKERVLRSQAELENYRKRAAREIDEHRRYANLPLMQDLLPVLDNIERAIAAAELLHAAGNHVDEHVRIMDDLERVFDVIFSHGGTIGCGERVQK